MVAPDHADLSAGLSPIGSETVGKVCGSKKVSDLQNLRLITKHEATCFVGAENFTLPSRTERVQL